MAAQRTEEILDAFEVCILSHGITDTSLKVLAEQAQMKRTILRHYIGNRDQIIELLGERWFDHFAAQWQQTLHDLPVENRLEVLIDRLFSERDSDNTQSMIIKEALFVEARRLPGLKVKLQKLMAQFIEAVSAEIQQHTPKLKADTTIDMAHGIYGIYMMSESLVALNLPENISKLKNAAHLLLDSEPMPLLIQPERLWRI
jgi:AcrR family transcriptional regulator